MLRLIWKRIHYASVADAVQQARKDGELDFLSDRQIAFLLNTEMEHEYAGEAEQLSIEGYDEGEDMPGEDVLFTDGYDGITDYLARRAGYTAEPAGDGDSLFRPSG